MIAETLVKNGPDLGRACMPLVRLLSNGSLSWANRIEIADAMLENYRAWKALKDEEQLFAQRACAGRSA